MNETKRFKAIPGIGVPSSLLIGRMKDGKPGDTLTDDELSDIAGCDTRPKGKGYGNLATAIKHCEKEHGIVWRRVRGAWQIRCLVGEEILTTAESDVQSVRRKSKRALRRVGLVDETALDDVGKRRRVTMLVVHGTLAMFADGNMRKKLEARNVTEPLDATRMLEAMK